jgi:hypothetical protein
MYGSSRFGARKYENYSKFGNDRSIGTITSDSIQERRSSIVVMDKEGSCSGHSLMQISSALKNFTELSRTYGKKVDIDMRGAV